MVKGTCEITGSIEEQCLTRLGNLYRDSHTWLLQASYNITKSKEDSEDLVQDLFEWLHTKKNPKLFWGCSYNLLYLHRFLTHRWINRKKRNSKLKLFADYSPWEEQDELVYDVERDEGIMQAYNEVMAEIQRLKKTRNFAPAMLYEIYWCGDDTLQEVADKIGISKSTVFISIKKIRNHLKGVINNPFK